MTVYYRYHYPNEFKVRPKSIPSCLLLHEIILLRQHKKRIIEQVASTTPKDAIYLGTIVMVMTHLFFKPSGCAPLEPAIIVVFPASATRGGRHWHSDRSTRDTVEHIVQILPAPQAFPRLLEYHWKLGIGQASNLALAFSKWLIFQRYNHS